MAGAWGPETWGPSPQEEEAARRAEMRARAREEQGPGFVGWLSAHPWVWVFFLLGAAFVVLGPWLHVFAPSRADLQGFFCRSSPFAPGVSQQCARLGGWS